MTAGDRSRRPDGSLAPGAPSAVTLPPRTAGAAWSRHHPSDQFAKSLLRDALSCASTPMPETEVEVLAATQKIDVYAVPDPARATERGKMGLLGELSLEPSLFEPFHNTPGLPQIRRVLCKQLTWHHELERRARAAARSTARGASPAAAPTPSTPVEAPPAGSAPKVASATPVGARDITAEEPEDGDGASQRVPFPWLVVICQGCPETVLERFRFRQVRPGVHEAAPALQMRAVVLAELPRTRETLLLRMLGAGRILAAALEDLEALPEDVWEKSVASPLLLHFRLTRREELDTDEENHVSAEIRAWYEDYRRRLRDEARNEGRSLGLDEGRVEEAARSVLTVLRVRGIAVPDAVRERILAQKDPERLEHWLERATLAASATEILDEPS